MSKVNVTMSSSDSNCSATAKNFASSTGNSFLVSTKANLTKSIKSLEDECDLIMELIVRKSYKNLSHNRICGSLKRRRHDELPTIPELHSSMKKVQRNCGER